MERSRPACWRPIRCSAWTRRTRRGAGTPGAVGTWTETRVLNGSLTSVASYDGATRTMTYDSPAGRWTAMRLDARGRVVEVRVPGLAPLFSAYDARGRLDAVTFGDGADARFADLGYGAAGV